MPSEPPHARIRPQALLDLEQSGIDVIRVIHGVRDIEHELENPL